MIAVIIICLSSAAEPTLLAVNAFEGLGDPPLLILLDSELTCLWAWATVGMESQIPWTLLEAVGRRRGL